LGDQKRQGHYGALKRAIMPNLCILFGGLPLFLQEVNERGFYHLIRLNKQKKTPQKLLISTNGILFCFVKWAQVMCSCHSIQQMWLWNRLNSLWSNIKMKD